MPADRPPRCVLMEQGLKPSETFALLNATKAPPKALMAKYYKTPWFLALKAFHVERIGHCMIWQKHTEGLTIHHNTYRSLFAEQDEDVLVICNRCHRKIHGKG